MKKIILFLTTVFASISAFSQDQVWTITNDTYEQNDVGIVTYNVMDYDVDNTGTINNYAIISDLLKKLREEGGGVLYFPAGIYLVQSSINTGLTIPKGVTVRGDWRKPEPGQPVSEKGTIIKTNIGEGMTSLGASTFIMEPSTCLMNLSIWHYNQKPDNIKKYPPTVLFGKSGYWGNEYCHVRNVTFINSYTAVQRYEGGGATNVHNIYGTILYKGIDLDYASEVCRLDYVHWSPKYWAESGLPDAPTSATGAHATFMKENAVGVSMKRNDWSYTSFFDAEGLKIGFHAVVSAEKEKPTPNGHNYGFILKNCKTGVLCDNISSYGIMFTDMNIIDCERGFVVNSTDANSVVQLSNSTIKADTAILLTKTATSRLMTYQTTIERGKVLIQNSDYTSVDGDFNNDKPQVEVSRNARVILTGNRFAKGDSIINNSFYCSHIDHTPIENLKTPPKFEWYDNTFDIVTKPAKYKVFNVVKDYNAVPFKVITNGTYTITNKPYDPNAVGFSTQSISDNDNNRPLIRQAFNNVLAAAPDATQAIQNALNDAGTNGGGIVYLPAGRYKVDGTLIIPTGVELKGANDIGTHPMGAGSVLMAFAGKNNLNSDPFISMEPNSGIRGIVVHYPEQDAFDSMEDFKNQYPYTIRGNAGTYIVNVSVHGAYQAIDLFTNKCDDHFVDYFGGQPFKNTVTVGGGSERGRIYNTQTNLISFNAGNEWKFGSWTNSPRQNYHKIIIGGKEVDTVKVAVSDYIADNHDFMILGDCSDQILYNNFGYLAQHGIYFKDEGNGPSGKCLGQGVDAGIVSLYYEALDMTKNGFDMVNSQIVVVKNGSNANNSAYIQTADTFKGEANLFSSDYWGGPQTGIIAGGGTLNLYTAHSNAQLKNIKIKENGKINIINSNIGGLSLNDKNLASNISVSYSVADPGNASETTYKSWNHNLTGSKTFCPNYPPMLDKTNWIAYASEKNEDAQKSIDYNNTTFWQSNTNQTQTGTHWYCVNMGKKEKFNTIIIDANNTNTSYIRKFDAYASEDSICWTKVATNQTGSKLVIVNLPCTYEAQYIKIQSTSSSPNRWSIYEFDLAYDESIISDCPLSNSCFDGILNNYADNSQASVLYKDGTLFIEGIEKYPIQIEIFNITGQQLLAKTATNNIVNTGELKSGIYILTIKQNDKYFNGKFFAK